MGRRACGTGKKDHTRKYEFSNPQILRDLRNRTDLRGQLAATSVIRTDRPEARHTGAQFAGMGQSRQDYLVRCHSRLCRDLDGGLKASQGANPADAAPRRVADQTLWAGKAHEKAEWFRSGRFIGDCGEGRFNPLFSPRGEAKCVRGASVRSAPLDAPRLTKDAYLTLR